jgi:hypothetical protein
VTGRSNTDLNFGSRMRGRSLPSYSVEWRLVSWITYDVAKALKGVLRTLFFISMPTILYALTKAIAGYQIDVVLSRDGNIVE